MEVSVSKPTHSHCKSRMAEPTNVPQLKTNAMGYHSVQPTVRKDSSKWLPAGCHGLGMRAPVSLASQQTRTTDIVPCSNLVMYLSLVQEAVKKDPALKNSATGCWQRKREYFVIVTM